MVFASHLGCLTVTQNSHPLPGLGAVKTIHLDPRLNIHLSGLPKTTTEQHRLLFMVLLTTLS
jgi:hypothetical protein